MLKNKILSTTMLVAPAMMIIGAYQPAFADCAVTSGGGTVAVPLDGTVITCGLAGGDHTTRIGNSGFNVSSSIFIEDGATIDTASAAIYIDDVILTLGDGATINSNGHGIHSSDINYEYNNISSVVTLGNNAQIVTNGIGVYGYSYGGSNNTTITLSGDNAGISTSGGNSHGVKIQNTFEEANAQITLSGDNAQISTQGLTAKGIFLRAWGDTAAANVTLGSNTSIISAQADAINVQGYGGSNPTSTIDSAGLIQGGANSISLDDGDDQLTLRTGSNLSSPTGANMGAGNDTLTLIGTGTEDEVFLNVESVNMDGSAWTLSSTSSFDDINVNSGTFTNSGALTIANNVDVSSSATFTGAGTLAGALDIQSGGTWNGTQTITGNVSNSGIIAPGNSIGTQTIIGNFTQGAGGAMEIEVNSAGNTDILDITGSATLDGAVNFAALDDGITDGTSYNFIQTTGGVTGSFSSVSDSLLFVDFDVQTVGNNVVATANRAAVTTAAQSDSESAVAQALDAIIASGGGDMDAILNALSDADQASDLLASQSGVVTSSSMQAASSAMGKVASIVHGRLAPSVGGGVAPTGVANIEPAAGGNNLFSNSKFWVEGTSGSGGVDGDANARGSDYQTYGLAAGGESEISEKDIKLGAFAAFSITDSAVDNLSDKSTIKSYQSGVYGSKKINDNWRVSGSASASILKFDSFRPTVSGNASADYNGYGVFEYIEVAHDVKPNKNLIYSPYIGLQGSMVYHDEYSEKGAGALNMDVDSETSWQVSSDIGVQVSGAIEMEKWDVNPAFKLGWAHDFLDKSSETTANFANTPSSSFQTSGPQKNRDSARIGLDLSLSDKSKHTEIYTRYKGDVATDAQDHLLTAGVKFKFN